MNKFKIAALVALIIGTSCSHRTVAVSTETTKMVKPGLLAISVPMLKDKGKKFDFTLAIRNESPGFIIIYLNDISCFRGESAGTVKHTFFNTGERTIDFAKGESKSFNMKCNSSASEGDFKIVINRVFDNPSKDRKTPGTVIGESIVWSTQSK